MYLFVGLCANVVGGYCIVKVGDLSADLVGEKYLAIPENVPQ
jgi:Na+/H+-translocating membrane pyrophosphatase